MSGVCEKFCPVSQICKSRLETVSARRDDLHAQKDELERAAIQSSQAVPEELIKEVRRYDEKHTALYAASAALRATQETCEGPIKGPRGFMHSYDTRITSIVDSDERAAYYYVDAECGSVVGHDIRDHLMPEV